MSLKEWKTSWEKQEMLVTSISCFFLDAFPTNKVRDKEIDEQMHDISIRSRQKGNTITTELKRILSNAVVRHFI